MKTYTIVALSLLLIWGCSKEEVAKQDQPQATQSNERRGGNGGGNSGGNGGGGNNPNTPNYNPCATYEIYPIEYVQTASWNFIADTSICGYLKITWDAQPYFRYLVDSCNPSLGKYFISFNAIVFDPISSGCAGTYSTTNAHYITYGAGCSVWGGNKEYDMYTQYYYRDTTNKKTIVYVAPPFRFTTGLKSVWNCN